MKAGLFGISVGQANGNSRLSDKDADKIKQMILDNKLLGKDIAKKFNVSCSTVSAINMGD